MGKRNGIPELDCPGDRLQKTNIPDWYGTQIRQPQTDKYKTKGRIVQAKFRLQQEQQNKVTISKTQ